MRKLLSILTACILCGSMYAGDAITLTLWGPTTGVGSVALLPNHGVRNVVDWTTNIVLYTGELVEADNGQNYMVVLAGAGVTTNSPTNLVSYTVTDSHVYRPVQTVRDMRHGMAVYNTSTCHVFMALGQPAVADQGIYLAPSTGSFIPANVPQQTVYAISTSTGAVISAQEW
jgi:hypothetical protein